MNEVCAIPQYWCVLSGLFSHMVNCDKANVWLVRSRNIRVSGSEVMGICKGLAYS